MESLNIFLRHPKVESVMTFLRHSKVESVKFILGENGELREYIKADFGWSTFTLSELSIFDSKRWSWLLFGSDTI